MSFVLLCIICVSQVVAGIIEMEGRRFAFFTSDSVVPGIAIRKGIQVLTNVADVGTTPRWSGKVGYVALSIYLEGKVYDTPANVKFKVDALVDKFDELCDLLSVPRSEPVFLRGSLGTPVWPQIEVTDPEMYKREPPKIENVEGYAR